MGIHVHWYLPTNGDSRDIVDSGDRSQESLSVITNFRAPTIDYLGQVARSAEQLGYEAVLTPTGTWCEDAWIFTAALSQVTRRLKFLVAFRPGFISPTLAAHQAATFQRVSGGRLLLNIVTGGDSAEQRRYGDHLGHDQRYERTEEFLAALRGVSAPVSPANDRWIERLLAGEFVGGGWTEADNGTLDNIKTRLTLAGDHWEITGRKFYATGSLYADWLDVLGLGPDGAPLTALVRVDQPGVELVDDWPGFGQRTTASGSANYKQARIDDGDLIPLAERNPSLAPFYQIAMLAVLAGITSAALRDGIAALRQRKRNYRHALTKVPTDDPQLLQVLGRISALSFGAHAALDRASSWLDRFAAARIAGEDEAVRQDLLIKANIAR